VEINPCTEDGFVTLEARFDLSRISGCTFGQYIDPHHMCGLLRSIEFLERFRCSDQMGYAYAESGGRRIHAFQGGKIIVRRAEDETDARRVLRALARIMWGSVKCDCEHAMVYCVSGGCDHCRKGVCGCQLEPPMESGKSEGQIKGWDVMDFVTTLESGDAYISANERLRQAGERFVQLIQMLSLGDDDGLARIENEVRASCIETGRLATAYIIETDNGFHAGLGFILHGAVLNILTGLEALIDLSGKGGHEVLAGVPDFVSECITTFIESKSENLEKIEGEREKLLSGVSDENVVAIVNSGLNTMAILEKDFPR
jgi:hypothetical protein